MLVRRAALAAAMLLTAALGASTARPARADEARPCKPEAWADAVAAFAKQDEREPPPPEGVLFTGSSSIRMWNLQKSFPDLPVINRGFGGSQVCHAVHYLDELVMKHRPRTVVLYAGDNDLAAGKSPERVHRDVSAFVDKVRTALPETKIVYVSIKPSIARWKLAAKVRAANELIERDAREGKHFVFVDVWPAMLGEDGLPRKELLRDDGLHLTEAGYEAWTKLVRPHLDESK